MHDRDRLPGIIKTPFARTQNGNLVHISEIYLRGRHAELACPSCGEELVAKLGEHRARHFAHPAGKPNTRCSADTVLHETAKSLLKARIEDALCGGKRFDLVHRCPHCRSKTYAGIVRNVSSVITEHRLASNSARADIALLNKSGEIVRIVEVVNTHNLEPETEAVYRQLQLPVWIYVVRGFGNLEKLRTKRLLHARPLLHDCPAANARKLAVNSSPEVIVQRFISTPDHCTW